jgi:hypothetical protein
MTRHPAIGQAESAADFGCGPGVDRRFAPHATAALSRQPVGSRAEGVPPAFIARDLEEADVALAAFHLSRYVRARQAEMPGIPVVG